MIFVKVFSHNNSPYPYVWQEPLEDAMQGITYRRETALQYLQETQADHVIYATTTYAEDNTVKEVHLYMEALSEDEFVKRTGLWETTHNGIIYAVHK